MAKKLVIQGHHISYDPEIKRCVYKGEHFILTQIQRRKNISRGFLTSLKVFLALNEESAKEVFK